MNILFYCQSLDISDPVVGDTVDRVLAISQHPSVKKMFVISSRGNVVKLSNKIEHISLNRHASSRIASFLKLLSSIIKINNKDKIDWIYLYMTPTLAFIFSILRPFLKFKIAIWFAHTQFTKWTRFNVMICSDVWFTVNKAQAIPCKHLKIIGQGVDLEKFKPQLVSKKWDFITIGRITPVKKIELILESLAILKRRDSIIATLAICGDSYLPEDIAYKESLILLTKKLEIEDQVLFLGAVSRKDLPDKINLSRYFVFTVPGGIGKATMEAMGVGLPMLIADPKASDFFTKQLADEFIVLPDVQSISEKMKSFYLLDDKNYQELSTQLRKFTLENFSLESFADKIVQTLKNNL